MTKSHHIKWRGMALATSFGLLLLISPTHAQLHTLPGDIVSDSDGSKVPTPIPKLPSTSPVPSDVPSESSSASPAPSDAPSESPSASPAPSDVPSESPAPSNAPSESPSASPAPSDAPSASPAPSDVPSESSSASPAPSNAPSESPSASPAPSDAPSASPAPSDVPSESPSASPAPSDVPSESPAPSDVPSESPSASPAPSDSPSESPTRDVIRFGKVRGTVFKEDGDGTQDPGGPGIEGVEVVITDSQGGRQTMTTDKNGIYMATVPTGSALTDIDEATLPDGAEQTTGINPTTLFVPTDGTATDIDGYSIPPPPTEKPTAKPTTRSTRAPTPKAPPPLTPEPPTHSPTALPPGWVEGIVFLDENGDGERNPGEPRIPDVAVEITDSSGSTHVVTTNSNGDYSVSVPPGNAEISAVESTLPNGSSQTVGTNPTIINVPSGGAATEIDGYTIPLPPSRRPTAKPTRSPTFDGIAPSQEPPKEPCLYRCEYPNEGLYRPNNRSKPKCPSRPSRPHRPLRPGSPPKPPGKTKSEDDSNKTMGKPGMKNMKPKRRRNLQDQAVVKYKEVDGQTVLPHYHPSCLCVDFVCSNSKVSSKVAGPVWSCPDTIEPLRPSKMNDKGMAATKKNKNMMRKLAVDTETVDDRELSERHVVFMPGHYKTCRSPRSLRGMFFNASDDAL